MRKMGTASIVVIALALLLTTRGIGARPLGGTLNGRVINGSGGGTGNVVVFVAPGYQTTTNGAGYYSVSNIPAGGGYNVVAFPDSGSGYANAHYFNVIITEGGTTTLNFTLSNNVGTLTGFVYDLNTGARISGVTLLLDSDVHDGWSNTQNPTGSDGVYTMNRIAAGRTYYLGVFPPSPYTQATFYPLNINTGSNTYNVLLSTSTTGIRGHVSLPGGGNAAGASIVIGSSTGGNNTCAVQTDSSGNYTCSLPPDSYFAHVTEFDGYPGLITQAHLSSGYISINFDLNNGPVTISGQVRDFRLNPINNANAQAFEQSPNYGHFRSVFVGPDGQYNFTGMGATGPYQLLAAAVDYSEVVFNFVPVPSYNWVYNFKLGHFPDVLAQNPNAMVEYPFYYVEYLRAAGVVNGFPDGSFQPNSNVRRGEYTKLLVAATGWAIDTSGGPHFSDVSPSYAFYGYIETAYHHGAINGYPDGTYRPNSTVSRAEATKISVAVSGWTLINPPNAHYVDVPTTHWAYQFIETARAHGANANDGGGYFRPNAPGTRAETAKLVCVANAAGCQ
jgi:S-layer homology domain/Carboxypeptidase regulatory-like domain